MFDSFKDRFRKMEQRLAYLTMMERENLAMTQLQKLFGDGFFMPLTSWSISPSEVLHVCNDLVVGKRECIIEFGAGFSTLCVAQLLKSSGSQAQFFSVESDAHWLQTIQDHLRRWELDAHVSLLFAPMTAAPAAISIDEGQKWYDTTVLDQALSKAGPIDLVMVDGPFGKISPHARYPALPYLKERLSPAHALFLDDAARTSEQEIARRWESLLGYSAKDYDRYKYFCNQEGFDSEPFGYSEF